MIQTIGLPVSQRGALPVGFIAGEAPVESMGSFPTQAASGSGLTAYQGIVGVAPRTLVRLSLFLSAVASTLPSFVLYRGISGHTPISQAMMCINRPSAAVQAQCIGAGTIVGVAGTAVGTLQAEVTGFSLGSTVSLVSNSQFPLYLFPGDALVCTGIIAAGTAQMKTWWGIAEYNS